MKNSPLILAIDTTNKNSSIAISKGKKILYFDEMLDCSDQSKLTIPQIECALAKTSLSYFDLDYVITTNGPGSFTGIRIGISIAKAIAIITKAQIFAIPNFEIHAYRAYNQAKNFSKNIVILDGFRNEYAVAVFSDRNVKLLYKMVHKSNLQNFFEQLIRENPKELMLVSGNAIKYIWKILHNMEELIILPRFPYIKAIHICKLANQKIENNEQMLEPNPIYTRPAEDF